MNNPIRSLIQDQYETRLLRQVSKAPSGQKVLEIGCGQGIGRKLIFEHFKPSSYTGIDLDPRMIERAKRKNPQSADCFSVGNAAALKFENESFDAVFDYGIIHHIPSWKDALKEVFRILKPETEFIFEEVSQETWGHGSGKILKRFLNHPYEEMFTLQEFQEAIQEVGFSIETFELKKVMGLSFFYGVARKPR